MGEEINDMESVPRYRHQGNPSINESQTGEKTEKDVSSRLSWNETRKLIVDNSDGGRSLTSNRKEQKQPGDGGWKWEEEQGETTSECKVA